jgi:hypothetical protein
LNSSSKDFPSSLPIFAPAWMASLMPCANEDDDEAMKKKLKNAPKKIIRFIRGVLVFKSNPI